MNYLRTSIVLAALAALFGLIGYAFLDLQGAAMAVAIAAVVEAWSYWTADKRIVGDCRAREVVYAEDPALVGLVRSLSARANMPVPRVLICSGRQPNALVVGRNPAHACLVLCGGIEHKLERDELAAVIGHELAHIRARDTLSRAVGVMLVGAIASLALLLGVVGLAARRNGGLVMIVIAILAPLVALIVHLAMSRSQEYAADRFGAELAGSPKHMIDALLTLEIMSHRTTNRAALASPATTGLWIVDPMPNKWVSRLFGTHPPIAKRVERLRSSRQI